MSGEVAAVGYGNAYRVNFFCLDEKIDGSRLTVRLDDGWWRVLSKNEDGSYMVAKRTERERLRDAETARRQDG